jgi:hypothetical protein
LDSSAIQKNEKLAKPSPISVVVERTNGYIRVPIAGLSASVSGLQII